MAWCWRRRGELADCRCRKDKGKRSILCRGDTDLKELNFSMKLICISGNIQHLYPTLTHNYISRRAFRPW